MAKVLTFERPPKDEYEAALLMLADIPCDRIELYVVVEREANGVEHIVHTCTEDVLVHELIETLTRLRPGRQYSVLEKRFTLDDLREKDDESR